MDPDEQDTTGVDATDGAQEDDSQADTSASGADTDTQDQGDEGDSRLAEGDGGGEAQREEGAHEGSGEAQEEVARRNQSKARHDRDKRVKEKLRQERDYLLQQNQVIMGRLAAVEDVSLRGLATGLDSQISECQNDAETAERLEFEALRAGDDEGVRTSRRIRERAQQRASLLKADKERIIIALDARKRERPAAPVPPGQTEVRQLAEQFRSDKPWLNFDQRGAPTNPETSVVWAIDQTLHREGELDTSDPEYWAELNRRSRAALPHLFGQDPGDGGDDDDPGVNGSQDSQAQGQARRTAGKAAGAARGASAAGGSRQNGTQGAGNGARRGPALGSSSRQSGAGNGAHQLSAERIAALRELGYWDDAKSRKEWTDYYREYDREHGAKQ